MDPPASVSWVSHSPAAIQDKSDCALGGGRALTSADVGARKDMHSHTNMPCLDYWLSPAEAAAASKGEREREASEGQWDTRAPVLIRTDRRLLV